MYFLWVSLSKFSVKAFSMYLHVFPGLLMVSAGLFLVSKQAGVHICADLHRLLRVSAGLIQFSAGLFFVSAGLLQFSYRPGTNLGHTENRTKNDLKQTKYQFRLSKRKLVILRMSFPTTIYSGGSS